MAKAARFIVGSAFIDRATCPCKGCVPPMRHIEPDNCHDSCERYKKWARLNEEESCRVMIRMHVIRVGTDTKAGYYDKSGKHRKFKTSKH